MNKEFEVCFFFFVILRSYCVEVFFSVCNEFDCSKVKYNYDCESCFGMQKIGEIKLFYLNCLI